MLTYFGLSGPHKYNYYNTTATPVQEFFLYCSCIALVWTALVLRLLLLCHSLSVPYAYHIGLSDHLETLRL